MRPRRIAPLLALILGILAAPAGSRAEPLVADLTSHLIGITGGFTGTSVVLFGATDGPGDIVVVVRGPERDIVVRRKRRVAGIWVNSKEEVFTDVPSFYSIASSRPLEGIATPSVLAFQQLGLDNLRLTPKRGPMRDEDIPFREALIRSQQRENLFGTSVGKVDFLGDRLFRTTLAFPSNVPVGTYLVDVFLIRNKTVVAGQTTPLVISKIGVDADIFDLADRQGAIYGVVAVITAMMAGWLGSIPFRHA
ncbi:MAG: TIGR02186 family protein [Alphaproteobacteria bacterium]|nr:TIGR02186 family protein [Alphaproteobacteria bacterium]